MPEHKSTEQILNELLAITTLIERSGSAEGLPSIERDLVLSKLRQIYEHVSGISQVRADMPGQGEPEPDAMTVEQAGAIDDTLELEETAEEAVPGEPEEEIPSLQEETTGERHEAEPGAETAGGEPDMPDEGQAEEGSPREIPMEEQPQSEAGHGRDKQPEEDKGQRPGIIAEKLTGKKQFIYDTLAEKSHRENLSSKLQSKPITDIGAAIGVNDKFQLVRDLFNGDSASFKKTVDILNGAANFNEAFTHISENFDWDMEHPSVQLILDLVRRKFIVTKDE